MIPNDPMNQDDGTIIVALAMLCSAFIIGMLIGLVIGIWVF